MYLKVPIPLVSGLYSAVRFAGGSTEVSTREANQVERLQTGNPQLTESSRAQLDETEVSVVKHPKAKLNNRVICEVVSIFLSVFRRNRNLECVFS